MLCPEPSATIDLTLDCFLLFRTIGLHTLHPLIPPREVPCRDFARTAGPAVDFDAHRQVVAEQPLQARRGPETPTRERALQLAEPFEVLDQSFLAEHPLHGSRVLGGSGAAALHADPILTAKAAPAPRTDLLTE